MSSPVSTIGLRIGYAAGAATATSITSFTHIRNIKSHGTLAPGAPNTADATTFDDTDQTQAIPLLGAGVTSVDFTANNTADFISDWSAAVTAMGTNGGVWICIYNPYLKKGTVFFGKPVPIMGFSEENANDLSSITVSCGIYGKPELRTYTSDPVSEPSSSGGGTGET